MKLIKTNKCQSIQRVKKLSGVGSCSVPLKNPELGQGGKPTNVDDVV
jgi:hypothetical protein